VTRAARGFAAKLIAHGVLKGDKVLLWGENRPEWIACYWGIQLAGAIAVPIDYRSSREFTTEITRIVGAKVILVGDDTEEVQITLPGSGGFPISIGQLTGPSHQWRSIGTTSRRLCSRPGATADPKGVVIRHRNILANTVPVAKEIDKYKKYARPFSPIRFLNLLPLSHMFGQSMATNIPPLIDGTVVFMRSFNPHDIVRRVREWRISVIVCVPKILDVLKEHALRIDPAAADPQKGLSIPARWWRYRKIHRMFGLKFWAFIVGAAPLGSALEDYWKRLGFVVIQGYGLTETAPIVTMNHPFKTNTGSVGKPIAGVEVKIAEDGEILVRGENVTTGYYEHGLRGRGSGIRENARRRRVVTYRRLRREGRGRTLVHPRAQEGNDRDAGRTQRLSG
jgi:long-chain acyl-CoA synthetase